MIVEREARRRRRWPRIVVAGALILLLFALGVAIGQTIDDNAVPRGNRTHIRTLVPSTVRPAATTVTTSVRNP